MRICVRVLTIASLLLFGAGRLYSEVATPQEMEHVAQNWLTYMTAKSGDWAGSESPEIIGTSEIYDSDTLLARCYHVSPVGYVVVPVLKELPPVKASSESSNLDVDASGGMTLLLRQVLHQRIRLFVNRHGSLEVAEASMTDKLFHPVNRDQWDRFAVSPKQFRETMDSRAMDPNVEVGPLLTSSWDQGYPYNILCPMGDGGRCVVGCVATAIAQIMYYWQWPYYGEGARSYYWPGDFSCGGSTPGQTLSADFRDPFDWANMVDSCDLGCSGPQQQALAELCYEVGIAVEMDYGYCGSGTSIPAALNAMPTYFKYNDTIDQENRAGKTAQQWFDIIVEEIDAGRPMQYFITGHEIVCDGYRTDPTNQYHMNYGWGGPHTAWFAIDNIFGSDSYLTEALIRRIMPFNTCNFTAVPTLGHVPLEVAFEGTSDLQVDAWTWDLGDGDSASGQTPVHVYQDPGVYDVILEVDAEGDTYSTVRYNLIVAHADSMVAPTLETEPGDTVELVIHGRNVCPLERIRIPVEFSGALDVEPVSPVFSVEGCRTESLDVTIPHFDMLNKRLTLQIEASESDSLPNGEGPIVKLYFFVSSSAGSGESTDIVFDGYDSYLPLFEGPVASYEPVTTSGMLYTVSCCIADRGNVDNDPNDAINIVDVTFLVAHLFGGGPEPECFEEADMNADGALNIADLTCLVSCLFGGDCACIAWCP